MRDVDVFLDPMCPWCWVITRWVRTVRDRGGLRVTWRLLSLRLLDEAAETPPPRHIAAIHERGLELLHLLAAVRRHAGNDAVGRMVETIGEAVWEQPPSRAMRGADLSIDLPAALRRAGLDIGIADTIEDVDIELVRAESALAVERVGPGLGTPVITFGPPDGPSFFGPVITQVPDDYIAAIDLWRALERLATHDGFAALRTNRRGIPDIPVMRQLVAPVVHATPPSGVDGCALPSELA